MKLLKYLVAFVAFAFMGALTALPASAQATRTWVSGVGDDANPCSRTAPCKTFAGAISKTATNGEINCLDPAGFGAVTITKSIAILCDGVVGGVLNAGTFGINVNVAGGTVFLKGLDIQGAGTGTNGITISQADTVTIVDTVIRGDTVAGINVAPSASAVQLDIYSSTIGDSAAGIVLRPTGSGAVRFSLTDTHVFHNTADGLIANANVTTGNIKGSITDSSFEHNGADGISVFSNSGVAQVTVDSSSSTNNVRGLSASGNKAILRFTRSTVTANGTGVNQDTSGQALSYGTNSVAGNGTDGTYGTTAQN